MIAQVQKFQVKDPVTADQVNRLQDSLRSAVNPALNCILLNGVQINGVKFINGMATPINHGLGRAPIGYFVTSQDASAGFFKVASQPSPTLQLVLQADGDVTASFWIF
jgi:hypothetical protein